MGKEGPCCHCGVTSTPLWRNGPPEKPILCNACGSRWRTKGTLKKYMPLHATIDPNEYEDNRAIRVKSTSLTKNDEQNNRKRLYYESTIDGVFTPNQSEGFLKNLDEDTSNRSSSGSAISNSESCTRFSSTDASDLIGPTQSIVWDALVPSRKRTCITCPKQSPVEKLTKDLYTILHGQSSIFTGYPEEDLLFESEVPLVSVEIGHGSVLIRHPSSMPQEEEHLQKEDLNFTPRNLLAMHADHGTLMLDTFQFKEDNSDHDLLLDIPSNGSFPLAELLRPTSCFASQQACTSSNSIR